MIPMSSGQMFSQVSPPEPGRRIRTPLELAKIAPRARLLERRARPIGVAFAAEGSASNFIYDELTDAELEQLAAELENPPEECWTA